MKFVPKDPGESRENSAGGGLGEFLRETALMLAANWLIGAAVGIAVSVLVALIVLGIWLLNA